MISHTFSQGKGHAPTKKAVGEAERTICEFISMVLVCGMCMWRRCTEHAHSHVDHFCGIFAASSVPEWKSWRGSEEKTRLLCSKPHSLMLLLIKNLNVQIKSWLNDILGNYPATFRDFVIKQQDEIFFKVILELYSKCTWIVTCFIV